MKIARGLLQLSIAVASVASSHADISPTQFIGSGIVARSETGIRMEKARVEIEWGTPCALTATFQMMNSSGMPQDVRVGFPMPDGDDDEKPARAPDDLKISFDGIDATVTPPGSGPEDRDPRRDWVWYHCQHTFKPGTTIVVVKSPFRPSLVSNSPFRESLFYCIETGANWGDTIGEEEVTVRFPHPLAREQITSASPVGYQIDGDLVRWRFADFKPRGKDHDIALTYVRPDVMKKVSVLRQAVMQHPDSSAAAVELAKHLAALGNTKSNSGFPPSRLTKEQYVTLLLHIAPPADHKTFVEHYRMNADGFYEEVSSEWTNERVGLVQILADAGYRDQRSQLPFVLEAERLLKNTLARDPHNAEAWNVYLANYWRFSFAAIGHRFGMTRLSHAQAKLIETAARNCPDDECIRLWLALRRSSPDKRDTTELFEAIEQRGLMKLEFPQIYYSYR